MDKRIWLDVGEPIESNPERVRVSITTEWTHADENFWMYEVVNGSLERGSLDTLGTPAVRQLRDEHGEWNIHQLPLLGKEYLLRTWETLGE